MGKLSLGVGHSTLDLYLLFMSVYFSQTFVVAKPLLWRSRCCDGVQYITTYVLNGIWLVKRYLAPNQIYPLARN